jgi:sugar phosphate isomerase/epimerase
MAIVISALHFAWKDLGDCFRRVRTEFGLDGVELSWHRSFVRPHCTEADFAEIPALAGGAMLELSAHIWEDPAQLGPEKAASALGFWLERCTATGVRTLVLHGGAWPHREEGLERTREALLAVQPAALAAGVTLCLENHYAYDYRQCHELLSEPWEFHRVLGPAAPGTGFCFDTGHGHMTRNGETLIRELAPRLQYVHLADNHGEHDDHCGFRQGTVPWDVYLETLREVGFRGPFCIEFPVRNDLGPFHACVKELRAGFPSE